MGCVLPLDGSALVGKLGFPPFYFRLCPKASPCTHGEYTRHLGRNTPFHMARRTRYLSHALTLGVLHRAQGVSLMGGGKGVRYTCQNRDNSILEEIRLPSSQDFLSPHPAKIHNIDFMHH